MYHRSTAIMKHVFFSLHVYANCHHSLTGGVRDARLICSFARYYCLITYQDGILAPLLTVTGIVGLEKENLNQEFK